MSSAGNKLIVRGNTIATSCREFNRMATDWKPISHLLGGTKRMRAAGEVYLPKEPAESLEKYRCRLNRTFLYNAFKDSIEKQVAKPFSRTVTLENSDGLPESMASIEKNTDKKGSDLTQFAKNVFFDGKARGLSHILIDFPNVPEGLTKGEEQALKLSPSFLHIPATSLFFWDSEVNQSGEQELTEIRYLYFDSERDGNYADKEVMKIKLWRKDSWEEWTEVAPDSSQGGTTVDSISDRVFRDRQVAFELTATGRNTLGQIPLVTFYTKRIGFMTAEPPLLNLAELNLEHWQSSSDQRNILKFVRLAQLYAAGFSADEIEEGIVISTNSVVASTNPDASLKYVEHTGKGIESGRDDLKDIESRMDNIGAQSTSQKSKDVTATGAAINDQKTNSDLQSETEALNVSLNSAYDWAARWVKESVPEKFEVRVFKDFTVSAQGVKDVQDLQIMRENGDIDQKTLLKETKRRGMLDELINLDEVIVATKAEAKEKMEREIAFEKAVAEPQENDSDKDLNTETEEDGDDDAEE